MALDILVHAGLLAALAGLLSALWALGKAIGPDRTDLPRIGTVQAPPLMVYGAPIVVAAWVDLVGLAATSQILASGIETIGPLAGIVSIGAIGWWFVFRRDGGEIS